MKSLDFFDSEILRSILKIRARDYLDSGMSGDGLVPVGPMKAFEKKAYTASALYFREMTDSESALEALNVGGLDSVSLRERILDLKSYARLAWDYMDIHIRARFPKLREAIAIAEGFRIFLLPVGVNMPKDNHNKQQANPGNAQFLIEYERYRANLGLAGCETRQ